ncbi:hypothetical protein EMIT0P260_10701 [Pseudomonas sp. IT-P260]
MRGLLSEKQLLSVALCEVGNFLCCLEINQLQATRLNTLLRNFHRFVVAR